MSADGPEPVPFDALPRWVAAAIEAVEGLVEALEIEAERIGDDPESLAEARSWRDACLADFGELYEDLAATPRWQTGVTADAAARLAACLADLRAACAQVERACLAQRAAHDVMVSHVREALTTGSDVSVYARTGIARRTPDGPVSVSFNGRH